MTPGILILETGTDQEFLDCLTKLDMRPCYYCGHILLEGERKSTTIAGPGGLQAGYRCCDAYACSARLRPIIDGMVEAARERKRRAENA